MVGFRVLATGYSANQFIEMEEPAFLRRLRQQHAGGGGPDRYIAPRNRKTAVDDDDDAPAYVLEGTENKTISREEFKAMTSGNGEVEVEENIEPDSLKFGEEAEGGGKAEVGEKHPGRVKRTNVTDIGVKGKRRKAAKVGGDGDTREEEGKAAGKRPGGKSRKNVVKLSFEDD